MAELFAGQTIGTLLTVVSGVLVFVICEVFMEFVMRPIREYKNLRANVVKALILYSNLYYNPVNIKDDGDYSRWTEGSDTIRSLAAEVAAFVEIKPAWFFVFYIIPGKKKLKIASSALIGISNSFFTAGDMENICQNVHEFRKTVEKSMRIF